MKHFFFFLLIACLSLQQAMAQTSQPPKEMIEQIVALKTFLSYLKKGYQIVHSGLQTVNQIKNGDFNIHQSQFDRRKQVTASAKKTAAIYGTAVTQASLLLRCQQLLRQTGELKTLSAEERAFCRTILLNLLDECKLYVDELIQLITAGELELKEEERINRIVQLQQRTIRLDASVRSLSEQLQLFSIDRIRQQYSIDHSKQLNNLQ